MSVVRQNQQPQLLLSNYDSPDQGSARQEKQIEKIVRRMRDRSVASAGHSGIDFLDDVKCVLCVPKVVSLDHDFFNELVS